MRLIGLVLAVSFALAPFATVAQQAGKVYRVGVIGLNPISASVSFIRALEAGLSDAGYSHAILKETGSEGTG